MKSLATFYIICIIILYSVLTFIGYRKEKLGSVKEGILAEVTVSAPSPKSSESKLLAGHFDNVFIYLQKHDKKNAEDQLRSALMVFTIKTISNHPHDMKEFWVIVKNMSDNYKDIAFNRVSTQKINKTFESVELFIAKELFLESSENIEKNDLVKALEEINHAEESIALATKYSAGYELEAESQMIRSSSQMVKDVIKERESAKTPAVLKRFWYKINNTEGSQV